MSPIAIIGVGCMFPKANGLEEYWSNIKRNIDAIEEIPETHWRPEDYFDEDPKSPDKTYARRGGFLTPIDFNPLEFGVTPNAIEATDTTQLLGMVVAKRALEDAGYWPADDEIRRNVSVLLGVTGTLELVIPLGARLGQPKWRRALKDAGVDDTIAEDVIERIAESYVPWQENSFPGLLGNVAAGRIANKLDLGGTNTVVDAACASSLSAIHLGCMELATGKSDMVVSGGLDTFNDIFMYMCFSKTPALSPTGNAKPFDKNADGTILGEGIGIVILKRLEDAERDNDRIYAVIKGVGSSSDGSGNAIYAPCSDGQGKALRDAYNIAGISPETIELVEGHGTGTKVGDTAEVNGLTKVFREASETGRWCALGSVKSQIGHTKAAAGAAGLIKAVLALHNKVLPPTIKVDEPLDVLDPDTSPFYVNTSTRPWLANDAHPRRAGVSSFGFGGSNFHVVLEEYGNRKSEPDWDGSTVILPLAAANRESLQDDLQDLPDDLTWDELRVRAFDLREAFDTDAHCRLVMVLERDAFNLVDTKAKASQLLSSGESQTLSHPSGIYYGEGDTGQLAVVFPGQGSQSTGMLRDLACHFPEFLQTLDIANAAFSESADGRLTDLIYPLPDFREGSRARQESDLRQTQNAQPAIGAVSIGAYKILESFGLHPEAAAGHSFGELTALCASGRLDVEALISLARVRGELMASGEGDRGSMLAVKATLDEVNQAIDDESLDLIVANKNAPSQSVLSGATSEIERAEEVFKSRKLPCKTLPVSAAFHSSLVAGARQPFADALSETEFGDARFPVYSNSTADEYPIDSEDAQAVLASQLACPVEFVQQIENMYGAGIRTFIEVGPGKVLTSLIKSILSDRPHVAIAIDSSGGKKSGVTDLACALSQLAALGRGIALERWDVSAEGLRSKVEAKKPAMTVKISGANYVTPRTPKPPTVRKPEIREGASAESTRQNQTKAKSNQEPGPQSPAAAPTSTKINMTQSSGSGGAPAPAAQQTVAADPSALAQALQAAQQNITALQQLQQQTAALHQQFLEGQTTTQQTFLKLIDQQHGLVSQIPDFNAQDPRPQSVESPKVQSPSTPYRSATSSPDAQHSSAPLAPTAERHEKLPDISTPTRPHTPKLPRDRSVTRDPQPTGVAFPAPANGNGHYEKGLLNIVAEKTGYPAEMLNLDMEMDADLGIDSIKRVEILSAFQEAFPDVPEITSEHLGEFNTLRDVVDFLHRFGESTEATPEAEAEVSHYIDEVSETLLSVVAEKTGYPAEMLELDMELDSDLGIDSIKRVEILSALEERLPGLPEIKSEHLGSFESLRHVVDFVANSTSGPAVAHVSSTGNRGGQAPRADEVESKLLQVVAEKTGYPPEMLELDMEIDSDLGIDSIKRVEILSSLEEVVPGLPEIQSEHLGSFQTLRDVVDFVVATNGSRAAAAAPEESGNAEEIETALLKVVAEKTGYPSEMLELDMEIDSDLGIDSIKRVEILSALEEHVVGMPEIQSEQLGSFNTLRDVVSYLAPAHLTASSESAERAIPEIEVSEASTESLQRYVVCSEPINEERQTVSLAPGTMFLVVGEGNLIDQVCAAIVIRGFRAESASLTDEDNLPDEIGALVILASGDSENLIGSSFKLIQKVGSLLRSTGGLLIGISQLDGEFGFSDRDVKHPITGGLAGLIKTAEHEWPNVHCKAIDVTEDVTAAELVEELFYVGPSEVGFIGESAQSSPRKLLLAEEPSSTVGELPFSSEDVIVITGGARGVTAEVAIALAKAAQPKLVLFGRSAVPEDEPDWLEGLAAEAEIKRAILAEGNGEATPKWIGEEYRRHMANREILTNLNRIRAAGSEVHYRSVDVRAAESVRIALAEVATELGNITGMIHGAGVLADRLIEDKTSAQFEMVYETKVAGLQNLLAGLDGGNELKALITFASSTARFGRKGQVDYAAANEVLNKIVQQHSRRHPQCHALSFNWGPWEGGMVTPELRKVFASEGVGLIPMESGAQLLVDELRRAPGQPVELVILGPGSTVVETHEGSPAATQSTTADLSIAFERSLSIADHPFLASHVMNGKAVLPMAVIMEWLAHGAIHDNPGLAFHGFNDVRVLKGVVLDDEEPLELQFLTAKPQKQDGLFIVPVELRSTGGGKTIRHASGEVVLVARLPESEDVTASPDLDAISIPAVYESHLFHGEDFQSIQTIDGCSAEGIEATVSSAPNPSEWIQQPLRGTWLADPLVIDSVFQLMIVWSTEQTGSPSLPSYVGSYRQYVRSFPNAPVKLVVRVKKTSPHGAVSDIDFVDADGQLIARMNDYECTINAALREAFAANQLLDAVS